MTIAESLEKNQREIAMVKNKVESYVKYLEKLNGLRYGRHRPARLHLIIDTEQKMHDYYLRKLETLQEEQGCLYERVMNE